MVRFSKRAPAVNDVNRVHCKAIVDVLPLTSCVFWLSNTLWSVETTIVIVTMSYVRSVLERVVIAARVISILEEPPIYSKCRLG